MEYVVSSNKFTTCAIHVVSFHDSTSALKDKKDPRKQVDKADKKIKWQSCLVELIMLVEVVAVAR